MGTLGLSPSGSNSKRPEASRRETNVVGVAIKRHARIEHKTQGRKQRRVVCKVTTLPKLGFCQRVLSDLSQAPVRELSFGHVSVEGFNVNLSESLGLTRWDPRACTESGPGECTCQGAFDRSTSWQQAARNWWAQVFRSGRRAPIATRHRRSAQVAVTGPPNSNSALPAALATHRQNPAKPLAPGAACAPGGRKRVGDTA